MRQVAWILAAQYADVLREGARRRLRGVRIIALMPTLRQFKHVHGDAMLEELSDGGPWEQLRAKIDKTTYAVRFRGGSTLIIVPAAVATSPRARGLRGDIVLGDECDDIGRDVFESIVRPWFTEPWSLKMRLMGGTPRRGRQGLLFHLHELGQSSDDAHARYHSFHATYRDCPEIVDADEVEQARLTTPAAVFKREWECDFDAAEGLVYGDVWDEQQHVRVPDPDIEFTELIASGDQGYEDPGVFLVAGVQGHGKDATVWVLDEIYQAKKTIDWWCERLAEWIGEYGLHRIYYEPARPDWKDSFRKACAVLTPDVDKSIEHGVSAVASMLLLKPNEYSDERTARLYIHPRCRNLIRELSTYRRAQDPRDPDRYTEEIVDRDNHCVDSLRYMISGRFGLKKTLRK